MSPLTLSLFAAGVATWVAHMTLLLRHPLSIRSKPIGPVVAWLRLGTGVAQGVLLTGALAAHSPWSGWHTAVLAVTGASALLVIWWELLRRVDR